MSEREQPLANKVSRRTLLVTTGLGLGGALAAFTINQLRGNSSFAPEPESKAAASLDVTPTTIPNPTSPAVTIVPEIPTQQVVFSPTPELTITPLPTQTEVPATSTIIPTIEPTRTPTAVPPAATETPKPLEKSPLTTYGVFMGDLLNNQTKTKEGMIVIASIPPAEGQQLDQLLVHAIADRNKEGFADIYTFIANPNKIEGNNIRYENPDIPTVARAGTYILQGSLDNSGKILTGEIEYGTKRFNFEVRITGAGREKVIEAAKRVKSIQTLNNMNWTRVNVDSLFDSLRKRFKFELP